MGCSPLATYTRISPSRTSPKTHENDHVIIHCFVGQVTAKRGCDYFADPSIEASAQYVIGLDGSIGNGVDEGDRAWTTGGKDPKTKKPIYVNGISGAMMDQRAITIEVACDPTYPYAVTDAAMEALISLLVDICKRNSAIGRLRWKGDKSLVGKPEEQNMAVHRWFAPKECPGDYLYEHHGQIAAEVNRRLDEEEKDMDEKKMREAFTAFMAEYEKSKALPVPDSTPADWEKEAVEWATSNDLMFGDGTGNLMLHSPITRAQFCVMLMRYHQKFGGGN